MEFYSAVGIAGVIVNDALGRALARRIGQELPRWHLCFSIENMYHV
jgi:hypothetical protein